ncbi:hypothetical protein BRX37_20220 [Sphingomonas sp. S-NIH.Pt3_0716]|nr:hypothetical protein BRX37_20220 [Sphingomonas sp. S-NIH.Pt3_0716]
MSETLSASRLHAAFDALRQALPMAHPPAPKQFYALHDLQSAFTALQRPLSVTREQGGLINVWALAYIGHDEVRNAAALAGLWMREFGGETSRNFLISYLSNALPGEHWGAELERGYRIETEVCPLGDAADRVDLVIETAVHLIGVEVKIRAGLGREQLERYSASIHRRAELQGLAPRILLLAPFDTRLATVSSTTWQDVARAALAAVSRRAADRSFVEHLIERFADHIRRF